MVYVFTGMLWVFGFGISETKIADMWCLAMAVMTAFNGLEKFVEDNDAANARLFGTIANTSMFVTIGLFILRVIYLQR